jgi:glutathione S-transferase
LALAIEEIAHDLIEVATDDRGEIERLTGQRLVPVLVDGAGVARSESTKILEHLALREGSDLLPPGRRDQALSWILVDRTNALLGPLVACLRSGRDADGHALSGIAAHAAERRLADELTHLEGLLERGPYLFGPRPTVADIAIHAFLGLLPPRFGTAWAADSPRIAAWFERVATATAPRM